MISCTCPMLHLTYFIFSSLQVPKWSEASHASLGAKLFQLHNPKCYPAACYALLCLYHSVVRWQKPLYTEINTRVSKHRAPLYWVFRLFEFGAGILIHILDLSYELIHICQLACLRWWNDVTLPLLSHMLGASLCVNTVKINHTIQEDLHFCTLLAPLGWKLSPTSDSLRLHNRSS